MFNFISIDPKFKEKVKNIYGDDHRRPKKKNYDELWIGYWTFNFQDEEIKNNNKRGRFSNVWKK